MNVAHSAFNILNQTALHIKQGETETDLGHKPDPESLSTMLEWTYIGSESDPLHAQSSDLKEPKNYLSLYSMDHVVTIMALIALTNPIFLAQWTGFRHVIALTGFIRDDAQPLEEGQFKSFFRMYTAQFDNDIDRRDVLHLSEALREGFFSRSQLIIPHSDLDSKTDESALNKLDILTKHMEHWVIDETCVTVRCDWYVITVISIAALCAAGGLGIGFSVGERVNGVDPSNLATYLWVLAAFIILVAKSMHVSEWSWNDFLHMRARCRSVSELESITGVDGQLIIAKLLHDQHRGSVLRIRGPYNSAFLHRCSDGFSIDEPIHSSTLLLSGLTMLKVVTAKGHALVCLDFRRDTDLEVIRHNPSADTDYLICEQIDRIQKGGSADGKERSNIAAKHAFARSRDLKWKRVQGIYKYKDARFA